MEIPEIKTNDIMISDVGIRELNIPPVRNIFDGTAPVVPAAPPVVLEVGLPVIDVPGCVEAHESNNPRNKKLIEDDDNGLLVFCDGSMPSFNPIQYEPENLVPIRKDKFSGVDTRDKTRKEETQQSPEVPKTEGVPVVPPSTVEVQCPTDEQLRKEPVGFIFDSGRKVITGYKLDGTQCVRVVEDVSIIQQAINGLPPTGTVITTGSIAVVATTSALIAKPFADILLKVIKPTVKKVMKKIAAIRGKKSKIESVKDRRDQQRVRSHAIRKLKGKE